MAEEEINLVSYVRVIFRQKWLIISITLAVVALATFYNLRLPKQYTGSMTLEVGKIDLFKNSVPTTILPEPVDQVQNKISSGLYNYLFKGELKMAKIF